MKILFIGDSLTSCYNVPEEAAWTTFFGKETGSDIEMQAGGGKLTILMSCALKRDGLAENKPDVLFLMGGTNDILVDDPMEKTKANLTDIMDYAKENQVLVWLGLPPFATEKSADWGWQTRSGVMVHNNALKGLREWLKEKAKENDYPVFDFEEELEAKCGGNIDSLLADGLHPNREGYRVLGEASVEIFNRDVKSRLASIEKI